MNKLIFKSVSKILGLTEFDQFKRSFLVLLVMLLGFSVTTNATEYVVDKAVSKVKWEAKKVTGKHDGSISFESGSVSVTGNKISGGVFVMNMKSIVVEDITNPDTNKKLLGHLSSDDFFSVDKFPESKLVIKKVTLVSGDEYQFMADLTIKGITNPVEFKAKISVNGDKLHSDGLITVNRTLYGIRYGSESFFKGLGDKAIYDNFTLAFNVVALKK